jgi:hypothetical protein
MMDVRSPLSNVMPTDKSREIIVGMSSDREELPLFPGSFDEKPGYYGVIDMSSYCTQILKVDSLCLSFLSHERFSLFVVRPSSASTGITKTNKV